MRRPAGFTLLEILVALAVLGFLLLGLTQGARFGLAAWDSQARLLDRTGDLQVADRTLRRILSRLVPLDDDRRPGLRGAAHRLGLNPTTLYSKIRKHGIHRSATGWA